MFDSVDAGYIPILIIVIISAWYVSGIEPFKRVILTVAVPVSVSLCWFFVPRFIDLFRPLGQHDPWVIWGFMAATLWSFAAVPTSIIATLVFMRVRRRKDQNLRTANKDARPDL